MSNSGSPSAELGVYLRLINAAPTVLPPKLLFRREGKFGNRPFSYLFGVGVELVTGTNVSVGECF
jgi:hypothetical protein